MDARTSPLLGAPRKQVHKDHRRDAGSLPSAPCHLIRPRRHGRARCLSHRDDGQWQPPRSRRPARPWSYLKGSRTSHARHEGPTAGNHSVLVIHTGHGGADGRRYAVLVGDGWEPYNGMEARRQEQLRHGRDGRKLAEEITAGWRWGVG